jgi:lipase
MPSPLFVTRFGRGAPMLCLHGLEAHGVRYVGLASYLDGVEIVAPDLRGHGRSPRNGPFTLEQHVDDILPILRDLGPTTTLLGHSYGGLIAWEVARAAPDAVERLVLVDPSIEIDPEFARTTLASSAAHLRWSDRAAAFNQMIAGREQSAYWSVALDVSVGLEEAGDGSLRVAVSEDVVTACLQDQLPRPLNESSYRGPTLLLEAGREHGDFLTPAALADLRAQLGDTLQHVILDLPHTITADGPDILAEHVRRFLET